MINMEQNLGTSFTKETKPNYNETEITNTMQIQLAETLFGKEDLETSMFEFATSDYSSRFRKIIEENPELIEEYTKNSSETLEKIKMKVLH